MTGKLVSQLKKIDEISIFKTFMNSVSPVHKIDKSSNQIKKFKSN